MGLAREVSRSRSGRSGKPRRSPRNVPASEKRPKPERFHGRHVLNRYDDGMEKCIGCELCAGVCPAKCIYVRGADNPPDAPVSPGERYGFVYEINYLRCIHCDLCVEACPTEAITETKLFEFSFSNARRRDLHEGRELLVDDDGRARNASRGSSGSAARTTTRARGCARPPRAGQCDAYEGTGQLVGRARLRGRRPRPPDPAQRADRRAAEDGGRADA